MCGIHLSLQVGEPSEGCERCLQQHAILTNLQRRGPDAYQQVEVHIRQNETTSSSWRVSLHASVLQMRQELVGQPVKVETRQYAYYLCWNGEVYESSQDHDAGDFDKSDTLLIAQLLKEALLTEEEGDEQAIARVLQGVYNAEYAFLVLRSDGKIFYGRDPWGRRSLLQLECPDCESLIISSVAPFCLPRNSDSETGVSSWIEIVPGKVHVLAYGDRNRVQSSIDISRVVNLTVDEIAFLDSSLPPDVQSNALDNLVGASYYLEHLLSRAVERRMDHHETAVLFSGGLDSAVVAALAARHCKQRLYLYNVSFGPTYEKSADRQAALITHQTLQEQHREKDIVFRDIVVTWENMCAHEPHIRTILQPKATLMDVNIATALWFASGGGEMNEHRPRVLLLGMGADELLGGYGRHRKAFEQGGWEELRKELKMDQERFWERNLGRDDRIVADHGCEARFPFLDSNVTTFLQSIPLSSICDFSLPPGQGDKRILRLVAERLGIEHASGLVKRAIQFGSRISHLSDAKRFGSRRKAKGTLQY